MRQGNITLVIKGNHTKTNWKHMGTFVYSYLSLESPLASTAMLITCIQRQINIEKVLKYI